MIEEKPSINVYAVKTLYARSLYSVDSYETKSTKESLPVTKKNVLVLVRENLLPGDQLHVFLQGILGACHLGMSDVNLVASFEKNGDYNHLSAQFGASVVIMFGLEASDLQLPIFFPHYQVQSHNGTLYISSPDLSVIKNDKPEKQKLWQSLKKVFSI